MTFLNPRSIKKFFYNENGAATPFAIFIVCIFVVVGGLGVDFNKAVSESAQMQTATDSAAHAAVYTWEFNPLSDAKDAAMASVNGMLPDVAYFDSLRDTDLDFGYWNEDTLVFTAAPTFIEGDDPDSPLRSAVRATARLVPECDNQSRTILLKMLGWDRLSIEDRTIYSSYYPRCFNEGFVADDVVDMQSNSNYLYGFCMHSNTYVSLNQNNYFEPGTVVSMPSLADLNIPASGFDKNEGLQSALRQGAYRLLILAQMPDMNAALYAGETTFGSRGITEMEGVTEVRTPIYPIDIDAMSNSGGKGNGKKSDGATPEEQIQAAVADYKCGNSAAMDALPRMVSGDTAKKTLTPLHFNPPNHIYTSDCAGNGEITLSAGTYEDFVLVTNCEIDFSIGVVLDGVLIATEGDVSGSHLQIGLDDNCADDGYASIWTLGNLRVASGLQGFGAQILAWGDIESAAQADGMEGVSFISYGMIDGTSQNDLGYCNGGGKDSFITARYFRMVR